MRQELPSTATEADRLASTRVAAERILRFFVFTPFYRTDLHYTRKLASIPGVTP